jgi:hypothetical protein
MKNKVILVTKSELQEIKATFFLHSHQVVFHSLNSVMQKMNLSESIHCSQKDIAKAIASEIKRAIKTVVKVNPKINDTILVITKQGGEYNVHDRYICVHRLKDASQ